MQEASQRKGESVWSKCPRMNPYWNNRNGWSILTSTLTNSVLYLSNKNYDAKTVSGSK